MQLRKHLLKIILILFGFSLAGEASSADIDAVIAKMGGVELRTSEAHKLIEAQDQEARLRIETDPQVLERFVRTELLRRAVLQEARQKAWDKRPEIIAKIDIAQEQVVVSTYVNQLAKPSADYPSEDEVKTAYNDNKEELRAPAQYHISQIYIANPVNGDKQLRDAARIKASEAAAKAREKNADFGQLAKKYSEHMPSAGQGGEMGWLSEEQMLPEVRAVVTTMNPGDVSTAISTSQGWHIIRLQERKEASSRQLAEVHEYLVRALRWRKAQENESKYLDDFANRNPISVNQIGLSQLGGKP